MTRLVVPPSTIFDMDGVLVDSSACHAEAYRELWTRIGVADAPPYGEVAGRATREVVCEVTRDRDPSPRQLEDWVRFKQERARSRLGAIAAYPDVSPALAWLVRRASRLAVVTGASRATATMLLAGAGLDPWFPVVVTADDVARGKPDPEGYLLAIARLGGDPAGTLVVEDSAGGIEAGLASGALVVGVRNGIVRDHPRFLGSFPDLATMVASLEGAAG